VIDDPILNYFALGLLIVVVVIFYGIFIAIHGIPYRIAESRNHPHQDAIHAAGWVSLFTLHVLWPFLWIWAMAYQPERGWGFSASGKGPDAQAFADELGTTRRGWWRTLAGSHLYASRGGRRSSRLRNSWKCKDVRVISIGR
jgi:hypothetical protein